MSLARLEREFALRAARCSRLRAAALSAGVTAAHELRDKGRLSTGDVAFVLRERYSAIFDSKSGKIKPNPAMMNAMQERASIACQTPHANVHSLAGLDWVNRMLGPSNFRLGSTVLVNSKNPADQWRSLSFLQKWVLDGVVMSNDSPGFLMSSSEGARNDQLFNIAIQGPAQVNNGYEDNTRRSGFAGMGMYTGDTTSSGYVQLSQGQELVRGLIGGPFYKQFPLQMFDRKVRPLSELYVGLVCTKVEDVVGGRQALTELKEEHPDIIKRILEGDVAGNRFEKDEVNTIHHFQYVLFTDRQVWQMVADSKGRSRDANGAVGGAIGLKWTNVGATEPAEGSKVNDYGLEANIRAGKTTFTKQELRDLGIDGQLLPNVYTKVDGNYYKASADPAGNETSEPAWKRRGRVNMNGKRSRDDAVSYFDGITEEEVEGLVGAWRIGRVLDTSAARRDSGAHAPKDGTFCLNVNVDLSFLDWRALRRRLGKGDIGAAHADAWAATDPKTMAWDETPTGVQGTVMQWPTEYTIYPFERTDDARANDLFNPDRNIPYNPDYNVDNLPNKSIQRHFLGRKSGPPSDPADPGAYNFREGDLERQRAKYLYWVNKKKGGGQTMTTMIAQGRTLLGTEREDEEIDDKPAVSAAPQPAVAPAAKNKGLGSGRWSEFPK